MEESYPGGRALIKKAFQLKGLSSASVDVMLSSVSLNTLKQYNSELKKWWAYCQERNLDVYRYDVPTILDFFSAHLDRGASYGTLNSARSALALIISPDLGSNPTIKRFFKGILQIKPLTPKYKCTWDPSIVLKYLSTLNNETINITCLGKKLAMLIALATAQRVQTLSLIDVRNVVEVEGGIDIKIPDRIKTSGKNVNQPTLFLPYFSEKPELCVASALTKYIDRTLNLRPPDCNKLFITYKKPHRPASSQTISKWLKCVLGKSGLDPSIFTAHSTRHASTSAAKRLGVSLDVIRNTAGWSGSSKVL